MAKMNSCMFKVGYFLYTKTRIGYFYHRREITKYAQEHPDGHSKCHATEFMGHEYAVQNLKFAIHLNPDNEITRQKLNWASKQRKKMLPTCPSSLREEKLYNPFLRLSDKVILESLKMEQNEDDENNSHSFQVRVLNEMRERKEIYNQDV
ncbi:Hypothetical predicted protein [Octopus vulgaris]|uniref:Hydroxyacylglutathione hydrolase C-terminal domain-containing protein n=1 Tax=Octopus vulgaris TaxID=6645 RepID=A0AA36FJU9_OCTVU|nr:Hypothetical predicted protein [Octopus vulgaris]